MIGKLIKRLTSSKDPDSPRYRREMAERICGKRLRYVTERRNNVDEVIGREGNMSLRDGELIVFSSSEVIPMPGGRASGVGAAFQGRRGANRTGYRARR